MYVIGDQAWTCICIRVYAFFIRSEIEAEQRFYRIAYLLKPKTVTTTAIIGSCGRTSTNQIWHFVIPNALHIKMWIILIDSHRSIKSTLAFASLQRSSCDGWPIVTALFLLSRHSKIEWKLQTYTHGVFPFHFPVSLINNANGIFLRCRGTVYTINQIS